MYQLIGRAKVWETAKKLGFDHVRINDVGYRDARGNTLFEATGPGVIPTTAFASISVSHFSQVTNRHL